MYIAMINPNPKHITLIMLYLYMDDTFSNQTCDFCLGNNQTREKNSTDLN